MFDFPSFVVAAFPSVVVVIGGVVVGSARALSPSALHSLALAPLPLSHFLCTISVCDRDFWDGSFESVWQTRVESRS